MSISGPPWRDAKTGQELPERLVGEGMHKECNSLKSFEVSTEVPEDQADKFISCKWVLNGRVKEGVEEVKARLVAREFNDGFPSDSFAATPTVLAQRLILSIAVQERVFQSCLEM